jgi:hypothetical protein
MRKLVALAVWTALAVLALLRYGPSAEVAVFLYAAEEFLRWTAKPRGQRRRR